MINSRFTSFPVLTTERLTLRQLSLDDKQDIFALRSDPAINKYLEREPGKSIEDAIRFISMVNDNITKRNSLYWVITLTATNAFAGTICLFDFSNETNSCETGYELMTRFQGQGIMKEAAEKVMEYAFQKLQFQNIKALSHRENQQSVKLLTKLGFLPTGETEGDNPDFIFFRLINSSDKI